MITPIRRRKFRQCPQAPGAGSRPYSARRYTADFGGKFTGADTVLAGLRRLGRSSPHLGVPGQSQARLIFSLIPEAPKSPRYTRENEVCVFKFAIRGDASEELLGGGVFQC